MLNQDWYIQATKHNPQHYKDKIKKSAAKKNTHALWTSDKLQLNDFRGLTINFVCVTQSKNFRNIWIKVYLHRIIFRRGLENWIILDFFYRTRVWSLAMLVSNSLTNWLTDWLTFSKIDWCDPGVWRCQLKTCWGCYCCWCWCWGKYLQQFVTDLGADVWS